MNLSFSYILKLYASAGEYDVCCCRRLFWIWRLPRLYLTNKRSVKYELFKKTKVCLHATYPVRVNTSAQSGEEDEWVPSPWVGLEVTIRNQSAWRNTETSHCHQVDVAQKDDYMPTQCPDTNFPPGALGFGNYHLTTKIKRIVYISIIVKFIHVIY